MKLEIVPPTSPEEGEKVEFSLVKDNEDVLLHMRTPSLRSFGQTGYWIIFRFREDSGKIVVGRAGNIADPLISTDLGGRIQII